MSESEDEWEVSNIFEAAENGFNQQVRRFIDEGQDPNIQSDVGYTPLFWASDNGHTSTVKLLLELGALPNLQEFNFGENALSNACSHGIFRMVMVLLKHGANPNIETFTESLEDLEKGDERVARTPLMLVSFGGRDPFQHYPYHHINNRLMIAKLLIYYRANVNFKNINGQTPLTFAAEYGSLEVVELLLERNALYIDEAILVANTPQKRKLLNDYRNLQFSKQNLALMSSLNPRLGVDTPLKFLRERKILETIMSLPRRYNPKVNIFMRDENQQDKLTKARQRLAFTKSRDRISEITGRDLEPTLFSNISKHLSRYKPDAGVLNRLMIEEMQGDPDEDYLRTLKPQDRKRFLRERGTQRRIQKQEINDEDWEEILREHPELRSDQTGVDNYDVNGYDEDWEEILREHPELRSDQTGVDNYDVNGYDVDGYDVDGYDANGYDVDGYDANGYDVDGYDVDGYDANGYDVDGYDVDGNKKQSAGYKNNSRKRRKHKTKKRLYRFY
jgi:hypothetical protein